MSAVAFGYLALPTDRPNPLVREQMVGPFDLENIEAEKVLQIVVDSAPRAVKVRICKSLAKQKITIKTSQPQAVGHVLGDVAVQLQTGIGDEFQPYFRCRRFFDSAILIEKRSP